MDSRAGDFVGGYAVLLSTRSSNHGVVLIPFSFSVKTWPFANNVLDEVCSPQPRRNETHHDIENEATNEVDAHKCRIAKTALHFVPNFFCNLYYGAIDLMVYFNVVFFK